MEFKLSKTWARGMKANMTKGLDRDLAKFGFCKNVKIPTMDILQNNG